jgi:parvulin-like peptidyl-prolyl isomerase
VSKGVRLISALGAVLFALVGLAACGSGIPGNAVVSVNGTPITTAAFKHWLTVAAVSGAGATSASKPAPPEPPTYKACIAHLEETAAKEKTHPKDLKKVCEEQYKSLLQEVLGFLISSQWVLSEANALGVSVSDAQVKKQFQTIKNQQFPSAGEFEKFLQNSGQTISDLLLRVKLNMLSTRIQQKIIKKNKNVSQADITKYYNENHSRYVTPEKRNVELILVKTEAAAKSAKKEIESGKSFSSVAKRVSIDPTSKANGGLLTEVVKGQEEPALEKVVFSAKTGVLMGPVHTTFGYYVLQVTGTKPSSAQSLTQARSAIKAQLSATREQKTLSDFIKQFKKKWKEKTNCRGGYIVANCKQYKAPKGTPTSPTG